MYCRRDRHYLDFPKPNPRAAERNDFDVTFQNVRSERVMSTVVDDEPTEIHACESVLLFQ